MINCLENLFMNKKILDILEKYHQDGYIDYHGLAALGLSNKEVETLIATMNHFLKVINIWGKEELKKEMNLWQLEMDEEKKLLSGASIAPNDLSQIPQGTLQKYFAKQPIYASIINGINRNNTILLQKPTNGFVWAAPIVEFVLQKNLTNSLFFVIENNQQQIVKKGKLIVENKSFTIELACRKLLPGRYYLKLIYGSILSLFEFFIHKNLMSD